MIKVLIVDDSALVRVVLSGILSEDPEIEVVGVANDPLIARKKIKKLNPDVLTLDVEMPNMDGLTFLGHLMRLRPMPVVMISSLTTKGADVTLKALELGAVDFVAKPQIGLAEQLNHYADEITSKVKTAARAHICATHTDSAGERGQKPAFSRKFKTREQLIAIGASTGGTKAILAVLAEMPADSPAVVVTQHIPEAFSAAFAARLDQGSELTAREACNGERILPGHVYVAPGSHHLQVVRRNGVLKCRLSDAEPVNLHRPSVDVLFDSVATCCGDNAVGLILTGMGKDGARGLHNMRTAGAHTIAQDEASSVVWGMPGEAVKQNAAAEVLTLHKVASALLKQF